MVWKRLVIDFLNFSPFSLKPSKKTIPYANLKEILANGFAVTFHAGYVKRLFKILDFYNAKA